MGREPYSSPRATIRAAFIVLLVIVAALGADTAAAQAAQAAECRPEGVRGAASAESCAIAGTDYRLVRARTTAAGTVGAAVELLRDSARCPEWQDMCVEERSFRDGAAHRSIRHRRTGAGLTRRVLVSRNSWWRLADGGVVVNFVGADWMAVRYEGTRVLCLRERWWFRPDRGGRLQAVVEVVSDPQPPFGLTGAVTATTVQTLLQTLDNFSRQLPSAPAAPAAALDSLPLLPGPLPDLGPGFVRCQNASTS